MNISVGQAGRIGDGINAYHVYKITTTDPQVDEPFQVERRYSDFLWLHSQLAKQCAGYIIPPLPAKVVGILQGPAFLERRRAGLERFLQKVIEHEELKNTTHFKHFLECSAVELTAVKAKAAFERSESMPSSLSFAAVVQKTQTINSWWGKAYQRIAENNQVKLLAAKAGKEIPHNHTIEDPEFQKLIDYVNDLTTHVKTLQSKVKHAREQTKLTAGAYCDVIETLSAMADMDDSQEEMPTSDYSAILELLDTRARQIDAEMDAFSYGVDDFARWLRAVERAIHVREDRRFHYQAKLAAHARATAAAAAAASKSSSGDDADNQYESEPLRPSSSSFSVSHSLTQDVKEGKQEFEKIHNRVMSEIARFRAEKTIELRKMFAEFAALQIRSSAELSAVIASSTKTLDEPLPPKMTRYISQSSMSMSASFSSEGDENQVTDLKDAIMKMKARTQSADNQAAKEAAAVDPIAAPYSDVRL